MTDVVAAAGPGDTALDALAVPVFAGRRWGPGGEWLTDPEAGWLAAYLDQSGFTGKLGEVAVVPGGGLSQFATVYLVGVGEDPDLEQVRQAAGWLGRATVKADEVATSLHQLAVEGAAGAVVEGFLLAQYRFDRYRSGNGGEASDRLVLNGGAPAPDDIRRSTVVAEAVAYARDLVNEPAGAKPPATLAAMAEDLGARHGLRVHIRTEDEIQAGGFGGLAGVSAGSHNPPRFVEMWHEPPEPNGFLAVVGKGIVFDSGGLSLKSAQNMELMKTDMSGAAAVYGVMQAIARLGLPVKVVGIAPLAENMPGGAAQRPGDVLRIRNGKTIEVLNTDAEGRLILADALAYAAELEPDLVVDIATLTGACKIALGEKIGGVWSNDDDAARRVEAAAARAGERFWGMPLPVDYRKSIDSDVADMKNTAGRFGSAIFAALLLHEFVGGRRWAHLDIAGPARWPDNEHYQTKGGSGFGVRTLVCLAEGFTARETGI